MDAYSKLANLKPLIRSMVMSHRNKTVCIQELQRDFQDIEGFPIPYAQLGFENVFALLYAMPDIVKVSNNNGRTVVTHVSTPATEHVEQLIQRSCHRRRGRGYKPRYPPIQYQFQNYASKNHRFEQSYPTLMETIAPKRPIVEAEACVTAIKGDNNNNDTDKLNSPSKQPTVKDSNESMGETCEHVDGGIMSTEPYCDVWDSINMIDLPPEVMGLSHTIPKVSITHYFAEKAETNVRIQYVLNPNRIWLVSVLQDKILEELFKQMQEFYQTMPRYDWYVEANKVQHGMYCAVSIDHVWHRARIVGPLIGREVKIFFIDTGVMKSMDYKHIRYLYKLFSNIPAQAIRASLAGLIPKCYAWTRAESECLSASISHKQAFTAYTLCINHKLGILNIVLKDENNIINEQFAATTNARWMGAVYIPQGPEAYRNKLHSFNEKHPSFFCIEEGHFPTVDELRYFLDQDFDYEELYTRLPHPDNYGVVEKISRASNEQMAKLYGIESATDEEEINLSPRNDA
ncbi:uncharacterized protein LOC128305466 [Anopheles moucheti]|uniref:uncharacterized protein LOC128305466 n=1 Tax=Anopheles moucheti TaxID=186751 RepID=UPI0022F12620|nr:uncharacterized protein LOC128305466 [Anopheles moucheti]